MKALLIFVMSACAAMADIPTGTVTRSISVYTNTGLLVDTNFTMINGIAQIQGYPAITNFVLVAGDGCTLDGQVATLSLTGRVYFVSSVPFSSFSYASDASAIGAQLAVEYGYAGAWTNEHVYPCYTGSVYYAQGGPDSSTDRTLSNWVVYGFGYLSNIGKTNDMRGIPVLVDSPSAFDHATSKGYVDAAVGGVTPAAWANYPAVNNLQMNGHLILNNGWGLSMTGGVGIISYGDAWASTNAMILAHNGTPIITLASGYSGLTVSGFAVDGGTNATLQVSTNAVVSAPIIETTTSLVLPNWQVVSATTDYPVETGGYYTYAFVVASGAYYRAVQLSGTNTVAINGTLEINGTNAVWQTMDVLIPGGGTNTIRYLGAP